MLGQKEKMWGQPSSAVRRPKTQRPPGAIPKSDTYQTVANTFECRIRASAVPVACPRPWLSKRSGGRPDLWETVRQPDGESRDFRRLRLENDRRHRLAHRRFHAPCDQ